MNKLLQIQGARCVLRSRRRADGTRRKTASRAGTEESQPIIVLDAPNRTAYVALKDAAALSIAAQKTSTYRYQIL